MASVDLHHIVRQALHRRRQVAIDRRAVASRPAVLTPHATAEPETFPAALADGTARASVVTATAADARPHTATATA